MISKASAPGKVILFGEHFVVYGVKAILCAIDKRVTVSSRKITEQEIRIKSNIGQLNTKPNTPLNEIESSLKPFYYLADKLLKIHNAKEGIEVTIESDIPLGVGLGSSSACCVAGAGSISKLFENTSKEKILELAIEAEKTIFENTSGADCTVCTYGGLMAYQKNKGFEKIEYEPEFQLVIANSEIIHSTDEVVSKVNKFKENNEKEFLILCETEEKLIEEALSQIKENKIESLGKSMLENQKYLKTIGVSNETLEDMIEIAKKVSFGAKITGAGGGGCIFALTDKSNLENTITEFTDSKYECFSTKIDYKGLDTF